MIAKRQEIILGLGQEKLQYGVAQEVIRYTIAPELNTSQLNNIVAEMYDLSQKYGKIVWSNFRGIRFKVDSQNGSKKDVVKHTVEGIELIINQEESPKIKKRRR